MTTYVDNLNDEVKEYFNICVKIDLRNSLKSIFLLIVIIFSFYIEHNSIVIIK